MSEACGDVCSTCQQNFATDTDLIHLGCMHKFHKVCIETYHSVGHFACIEDVACPQCKLTALECQDRELALLRSEPLSLADEEHWPESSDEKPEEPAQPEEPEELAEPAEELAEPAEPEEPEEAADAGDKGKGKGKGKRKGKGKGEGESDGERNNNNDDDKKSQQR